VGVGVGLAAACTTIVTDFDALPAALRAISVYVAVAAGVIVTGELIVRGPDTEPVDTVREVAPLTRQAIDVLFPRVMVEGVAVSTEITGTDAA
jgi:hypothetical protein